MYYGHSAPVAPMTKAQESSLVKITNIAIKAYSKGHPLQFRGVTASSILKPIPGRLQYIARATYRELAMSPAESPLDTALVAQAQAMRIKALEL